MDKGYKITFIHYKQALLGVSCEYQKNAKALSSDLGYLLKISESLESQLDTVFWLIPNSSAMAL